MTASSRVCEFTIVLGEVNPPVWRRIQIREDCSFWDLHVAIQDAMGWQDCHLHRFRLHDPSREDPNDAVEIGIPDEDRFTDTPEVLPGWEIAIADYFTEHNRQATYEYDFGDGWQHDITREEILPRKSRTKYPRCVAGARACPPEDCGGPPGYDELVRILSDPTHEEYETTLAWVGGRFNPAAFDPRRVRFDDPKQRWKNAFRSRG